MQAGEQGKYVVPVGEEGKATGTHKDRPYRVLDLHHLTKSGRQLVVDRAMKTEDQDNEAFLQRYAERVKRCLHCCSISCCHTAMMSWCGHLKYSTCRAMH